LSTEPPRDEEVEKYKGLRMHDYVDSIVAMIRKKRREFTVGKNEGRKRKGKEYMNESHIS
jgi:hypothetical protein